MNPKGNDCEPCLREGINIEATVYCLDCSEILCEDCKRHHKKSKLLLNHKLIDTSDELAGKIDFTDLEYLANLSKCPIHSTEGVKYLCKNHDQLCCNECAIVNHRKCEDMESLAGEIKVNQEESKESTIAKRLETVDSYVEKLIKHESTYVVNIGMKENEEKACLKDLKAKLDAAYNKLETRIMFGWSEKQRALSKSSSLQKESAENLRDEIRQCGQKIKKAREFGIETNLFLLEREMAKKVPEYEENFTALRQHSSKILITLSEASPLQESLTNIEDIYHVEELKVEPLLPSFKTTKDFKKRTLALEHEVMLNVDLPYFCLWIGNYIVLSYSKSSKLEAYKAGDGSLLTTYHWCSSPTSVTATENDEFAVASSSSNKINIMKIKQSQIIFLRKLACPNLDLIAYDEKNKHLLSLCWSGTVIRMITLDGRYVGFIDLIGIVQSPLFIYPQLSC
ncbi:uncharacterized protein LOC132758044 [Ruditapes philippinarum]|uniref:uncharacterized protein LOC132758044 n=1 Tax=Ruditapes philippinarum TaxID=129788 RepID=UPI00295BF0A6|nr:uncharacterized protein LOC132758044 [Ruditapes philippinarum]